MGTRTLCSRRAFDILLATNDPDSGAGTFRYTAASELLCPVMLKSFASDDWCALVTLDARCVSFKYLLLPFLTSHEVTAGC